MYYLAFDVGGTNVKYAVVEEDSGAFIKKGKFKSPKDSFEQLISEMGRIHRDLKDQYEFLGLALSVPGVPLEGSGMIAGSSALPYIHGPNFKEALSKETGLTVHMENDAKCAALAEVWKGAGKDVQDCLFFVLGTGVGGAVIKDRKLHYGANRYAGEFGYMVIASDFANEEFRTLSDLGATGGVVKTVAAAKGISIDEISGEEIFQKAEEGDGDCKKAVENFYGSLAVGIFNLTYAYNPEKIILGGAISARPDLVDKIKAKLDIIKPNIDANTDEVNPPIVICEYEGDANLLGAVYHYITYEESQEKS